MRLKNFNKKLSVFILALLLILAGALSTAFAVPVSASAEAAATAETQADYDFLKLALKERKSNYWVMEVKNPNPFAVTVEYNMRRCHSGDAEKWTGLMDLSYKQLSAYGTDKFTVYDNASAACVAFSFTKGDDRYITYANNLWNVDTKIKVFYTTESCIGPALKMKLLGTGWLVEVRNDNDYDVTMAYCIEMCSENNAKNWTNLTQNFYTIKAGSYISFNISNKGSGGYVAVSYVRDGVRYITYANHLNASGYCRMAVKTNKVVA